MRRFLLIMLLLVAAPSARGDVIHVKLGMQSLTETQKTDLWQRVEQFATWEARLIYCKKPSDIVRRATAAVTACVLEPDLRQVAARFSRKLSQEQNKMRPIDCDHPFAKQFIREVHEQVDATIKDATRSCRACIFC